MPHTQGPWAVNPAEAKVDAFATGKPLPICALLWPTTERTETETEDNARLIAAAPDMLAELKELHAKTGWQSTADLIAKIEAA